MWWIDAHIKASIASSKQVKAAQGIVKVQYGPSSGTSRTLDVPSQACGEYKVQSPQGSDNPDPR